jgi:hypothetical protein
VLKEVVVVAAVLALVDSLAEQLSRLDAGHRTADECVTLVARLARLEKAVASARTTLAARAADAGRHRDDGFADPAQWLAHETGASTATAARDLETARRLEELPLTRSEVRRGALSMAQADEVAMTVAECPEAETEMVDKARSSSLLELREFGRKKRLSAVDPEELHTRQLAARSHRQWQDDTGMIRYSGALPPDVGIPFVNRMNVATDRRWRAARQRGDVTSTHEQLAADAFVELVSGGGKGHAVRADVVYVCDVTAGTAHIIGGGPVPMATFDAVARDGFVKAVLHDGTKVDAVVHYGRRALPAVLRTALELGTPPQFDGIRCVDCGNGLGLQWDHIDPVANGGPTCLDNEAPRCYRCHVDKTERDRRAGLLGGARPKGPSP